MSQLNNLELALLQIMTNDFRLGVGKNVDFSADPFRNFIADFLTSNGIECSTDTLALQSTDTK